MVGQSRLGRALGVLALSFAVPVTGAAQENPAERAAAALVRPGDRIGLHFLRERHLSDSLFVNERGEAVFPKIGPLHVTNFTIAQLQDTLRARYAEFFRVPELEIAVLRRVVVLGEVRAPHVYMVDGTSTVRDVIARAGGLTDAGSRGKVSVIRDGVRIPMNGWDTAAGSRYDLRSGDQIFVGRKSWLMLNALSVVSTAVLVTSFVLSVSR